MHLNNLMPILSDINIVPVNTAARLSQFIKLPWSLYQADPCWIPPLLFELRQRLNSKKNPFFEHADVAMWLALRDDKVVGRISAQIDHLYLKQYADDTGHFGMFEAENDEEVAVALFAVAEQWLEKRGMKRVCGPFNLSINQEAGLLVEGFDSPPSIMMGHGQPFMEHLLLSAGYKKVKDLIAYKYTEGLDKGSFKEIKTVAVKYAQRIKIRPFNRKESNREFEIMHDIFNDAWSNNWGYVPCTDAEFKEIASMLLLFSNDDLIQIAELDGQPVAFVVAIPNINEAARDLNGRLFPFGWLKLLWRLKVNFPKSARMILMGVKKLHADTGLRPLLGFKILEKVQKALFKSGIREIELSWVLEDNLGARSTVKIFGGVEYKRYRLYDKNLL
ncbi:hypothetical protein [uncultured Shewanella sp.]|uniref:hypothetical protein n=1 Tax=uncultured Shewanella sp. TaxID=173975 RepID=UPI00260C1A4A|nr:hypothetical protein [uncultured Shewanella sp.]